VTPEACPGAPRANQTFRSCLIVSGVMGVLALNSVGAFHSALDSNETYVVVNTLKIAATNSLEPSPFLAYGTVFPYLLVSIYGAMYLGGVALGTYDDPADFGLQFFIEPLPLYVAGRLVSAASATGTVCIVYLIGRDVFHSRAVGVLAGLFVLLDKVHFLRAQAVLPDATLSFFCTLFVYVTLKILHEKRIRYYVLAGIAAGLAIGTKANGAVVLTGIAVAHLLANKDEAWKSVFDREALAFSASLITALFVAHPFFFLKFEEVIGLIFQEADKAQYVLKGEGYAPYLWIGKTFVSDNRLVGVMYLLGTLYALIRGIRGDRPALTLFAIIASYVAVFGPNKIQNIHFLLPIVPALALMAADLALALYRMRDHRAWKAATICVICAMSLPSASSVEAMIVYRAQPTSQELATRWVESHIPKDKLIALDSYEDGPQMFTLNRYFESGRLQDYRDFVPERVRRKLEDYAKRHGAYVTCRIKYYHEEPQWPAQFTQQQIVRFTGDRFMEREYRLDWRNLEQLRTMGVRYIITSTASSWNEKRLYPPDHLLYFAHQKKVAFYESLTEANGVIPLVMFGHIRIFLLVFEEQDRADIVGGDAS